MWLLWPGWNIRPALQLSEIIREFGAGKDIIWHVFSTSAILDKGCCSALGEGGPSSLCEGVSAALDKVSNTLLLMMRTALLGCKFSLQEATFLTLMVSASSAWLICNETVCCDNMNFTVDENLLSTILFFVHECGLQETNNLATENNCGLANQG